MPEAQQGASETMSPRTTVIPPEAAPTADNLDEVVDRMRARVDELRRQGDDRRIFLAVYMTMTGSIHRAIRAGRFMDPAWTAVMTDRFATLYFDADHDWEQTRCCPGPWQAAFAVSGVPRVSAIEHALLGINAHIVYDLPFAVATTMREFGDVVDGRLQADTLVRRRHDYEVVNHLLVETIPAAQAVMGAESQVAAVLDRLAGRLDEYAAEMLLRASRTQGWHAALALAVARTEAERDAVRQHLDHVACGYVHRIDITQLMPTERGRAWLSRFRPPFRDLMATSAGAATER